LWVSVFGVLWVLFGLLFTVGVYIYTHTYIILFEQNCNNLKMAAIGRNM
jgi:hypothetical protein